MKDRDIGMRPRLCKNCGKQNESYARVCSACGTLLTEPASVTGYHTIHDQDRLEALERKLRGLMDDWRDLILEICVKLEEMASLCEGDMGLEAQQLAEQLENNLLIQDVEQLLDNLKAALAVLRENDNIAADIFPSGGSIGGFSPEPERLEARRMPEEKVIAPAAGRRPWFSLPFGRRKKGKTEGRSAPSSAASDEERCLVDQVYFSALTDALVQPGDYYTLRLFMGKEEHRQIIEKIKQAAEKYLREDKTDIGVGIRQNQQVRVRITSPVALIDENEMTLPWTGNIREFSFMYFVPDNVTDKTLPMTAHIYVDDVIATRLQIRVPLGQEEEQVPFSRQDVKEAFMSYSSKDREQVLTFVQGLSRSRPDLNIFLDVKSLRSGQDWQEKLSRKIDACQVLYLCWSRSAKESAVVDYEWRHAFNTKGAEAIEPVPLEPPQLCAPPKELDKLHFNDLYMMLRLAERKVQDLMQEDQKES